MLSDIISHRASKKGKKDIDIHQNDCKTLFRHMQAAAWH